MQNKLTDNEFLERHSEKMNRDTDGDSFHHRHHTEEVNDFSLQRQWRTLNHCSHCTHIYKAIFQIRQLQYKYRQKLGFPKPTSTYFMWKKSCSINSVWPPFHSSSTRCQHTDSEAS